ncbi:MAG: diacylglycerol kinase [Armatimonadota bacterium]|nr:MAG: diacylglycerol kinase [Armatimonadota bacterium]
MKSRSLLDSFRFALDGMVHVIRTQRHMRYHLVLTMAVIGLSVLLRVTKVELILLVLVIAMVLLAELFNTAIELAVDLVTEHYHPLAKVVKDVAGAAMLVATLASLAVGAMIFLDRPRLRALIAGGSLHTPANILHVLLAAAVLIAILVAVTKVRGGKGTLMRGGVMSAHAAIGAFLATTVYYAGGGALAVGAAALLALLVCQSRVEAGIHTVREVILGAVAAVAVAVLMFEVLSGGNGGR